MMHSKLRLVVLAFACVFAIVRACHSHCHQMCDECVIDRTLRPVHHSQQQGVDAVSVLNDEFEYVQTSQGTVSPNSYLPLIGAQNTTTLTGWQFWPQNATTQTQARVVVLNQNTSPAFQGALPLVGTQASTTWWVSNRQQAVALRIPVAQARSTTILYQRVMHIQPLLRYRPSVRVSLNRLAGLNGTVSVVIKLCDTLAQVLSLNQADRAAEVVPNDGTSSVTSFSGFDPSKWQARYFNYWTAPAGGVTSIWIAIQATGTSDTMDASLLLDDWGMLGDVQNSGFENPQSQLLYNTLPLGTTAPLSQSSTIWNTTLLGGMIPGNAATFALGRECIPSRIQICSNYTPSARVNAAQFAPDGQQYAVMQITQSRPVQQLKQTVQSARAGVRHTLSFWMSAVCDNPTADGAVDGSSCGAGALFYVEIGTSSPATITARVYQEDDTKAMIPERRSRQWRRVVTSGFNIPSDTNVYVVMSMEFAANVNVSADSHSELLIDSFVMSSLALVTEQQFIAPLIPYAACTLTGMSWLNSIAGTGLILWLKADEGVIVSNAASDAPGKVTAWLDQSAMGNDALNVTGTVMLQSNYSLSQPRPWVSFGINSAMHSQVKLNSSSGRTIAIVTRLTSLTNAARNLFTQKSALNGANAAAQDYWTVNAGASATPSQTQFRGHANAIIQSSPANLTPSLANRFVLVIVTLTQNPSVSTLDTQLTFYLNGAKSSTFSNSAAFVFPKSNGGFVVGGDWDRGVLNATQGGTVDIAEVALWNRTLSADELQRVGHYFTYKYQLNASSTYNVPTSDLLCGPLTNETNLCQAGVCRNNANCTTWYNTTGSQFYNCSCQSGSSGQRCEIANYCKSNLCTSGSTCLNQTEYANYTCACPPSKIGTFCNLTLPYVPNRQDCSRWPFGVYTAQPCDGPLGVGMVYPPDTVCDCCCDPKHQNAGTCICQVAT